MRRRRAAWRRSGSRCELRPWRGRSGRWSRPASQAANERQVTGWPEVDRVLGGGLVTGSVLLLGGEPGVGKSTLLAADGGSHGRKGRPGHRGQRRGVGRPGGDPRRVGLGIGDEPISLVWMMTSMPSSPSPSGHAPVCWLWTRSRRSASPRSTSAPGGPAQVRESAARLVRLAKTTGVAVVLVGHVTKEGGLAGPKLLEHMVDVVLYLEGDPDRGFRVLRCNKNRFGATHVSGMFDMRTDGPPRGRGPVQGLPRRVGSRRCPGRSSIRPWRAAGRSWSRSRPWSRRPTSPSLAGRFVAWTRPGSIRCSRSWIATPGLALHD